MKRYKPYIRPYISAFILGPILMITEVLGEIMLPKMMSLIINNGVANRDKAYIIGMGIAMVITAGVMALGGIGGAYFSAKASISFTSDLRQALFEKVQKFSFKNVDDFSTGSLVTRLTNDIQQIQNVVMMGLRMMFRAPGMLVGALIMAFLMNARLALVILVVIPLLNAGLSGECPLPASGAESVRGQCGGFVQIQGEKLYPAEGARESAGAQGERNGWRTDGADRAAGTKGRSGHTGGAYKEGGTGRTG